VIAKIAGATEDNPETELLQISADEQRRAARSAALFTEEELTRFLQVMLRTFDELGYRQEQRFHFELGLLKLVHLQRLLPVEEILSRFPASGGGGASTSARSSATPASSAAPTARATPPVARPAAPPAPAKPAFSPFAADRSRKSFEQPASTPAKPSETASVSVAERQVMVQPELPPPPAPAVTVATVDPVEEISAVEVAANLLGIGAIPKAVLEPEATPPASVVDLAASASADQGAEEFQRLAIEALSEAKSQGSAADALADAEWKIVGDEIQVQTELSKTMLPMVINPEAEKIVRAALRSSGAGPAKLVLLPGSGNSSAAKKPRPAKSGSVQAKALEHPVVQQAQRLFNAEIRNVIDLRDSD
jgi:DNA polymerase-3 subunit gamma/tau